MSLKEKKFSMQLPYNTPSEMMTGKTFVSGIKKYKDHIYDINVTCRIEPFQTDAMGVIIDPMRATMHIHDALRLQAETGVTISALFNNIYVPPTRDNLEAFIKGVRPLYEAGLRSMTIPHVLWLKFGTLQQEFPEMLYKSTVLRRVRSAQDFWNMAEAGFDYVMIDRLMLRDRAVLKQTRLAHKVFYERYGKKVKMSVLEVEGRCRGNCPFWEEHYQHTMTNPDVSKAELKSQLWFIPPLYSCELFPVNPFVSPAIPPFREDLEELSEYFDIIKMNTRAKRGREVIPESLATIHEFIYGTNEVLVKTPAAFYDFRDYQKWECAKQIDIWRKTIKTCAFQCWNCQVCTDTCDAVSREERLLEEREATS